MSIPFSSNNSYTNVSIRISLSIIYILFRISENYKLPIFIQEFIIKNLEPLTFITLYFIYEYGIKMFYISFFAIKKTSVIK